VIDRMLRAAKLDVRLYEEVEHDETAIGQAIAVVVIVALLSAPALIANGFVAAVLGVVLGLAGWAIWAWITYFVGTRILPTDETHASWGQMARTLGFAQSVGVLRILGVIPWIGGLLVIVVVIWQFIAMVVAVRTALDYSSTLRAVGVVLIGGIPYLILLWALSRG
jgi:hypothetical protein